MNRIFIVKVYHDYFTTELRCCQRRNVTFAIFFHKNETLSNPEWEKREITIHAAADSGAYWLWKEGCRMKDRRQNKKRPIEMVDAIIAEQRKKDPTDVLGSYTGVPWDEWDDPVQDADDL